MPKNTKEEASLRHEGELSSSDSDESDDDDNKTGAKDNTCYGGGDSTGARGVPAERMWFLSPSVLFETLGTMTKAKASLSKNREKPEVGKSKDKYHRRERLKRSS